MQVKKVEVTITILKQTVECQNGDENIKELAKYS